MLRKNTFTLLAWLGLATFAGTYLYFFSLVWRYAANVPLGDEWVFLDANAFRPEWWRWLITPHNEHPIVLTKAIAKILLHFGGWNLWLEQVITYLFFGLMLGACALVMKRSLRELPWGWILAFFLIFFSNEMNGMHTTGFNTQFHCAIFFKFLCAYFLLHPERSLAKAALAALCAGLSIISFGSGLPSIFAVYVIYLIYLSIRWRHEDAYARRRSLGQFAVALTGPAVVLAFVFDFAVSRPGSNGAMPTELLFWTKLPKVFGWPLLNTYDAPIFPAYALLFALLILPLSLSFFRAKERRRPELWLLVAGIASTMAECAAVTLGRAHQDVGTPMAGRYCEFSFFLVPWAAMAWAYLLRNRRSLPYVLSAIWLLFALEYRTEWHPENYVFYMSFIREHSYCLRDYYEKGGQAFCPPLYPEPLASRLEKARALNLSFYHAILSDQVSAAR